MAACVQCGEHPGVHSGGVCRHCRMRGIGIGHRKYHFTPQLMDELRTAYAGRNKRALTAALDQLQRRTGWPRHILKHTAHAMGWSTEQRRPWSAKETTYLEENLGAVSVRWIARKLHRSVAAVESKAEKLGRSRKMDGYNIADLEMVFGVSYTRVKRWMDHGLMGEVHRNGSCRVKEANVMQFLRECTDEYDLRRVDQVWFKGMIFGD